MDYGSFCCVVGGLELGCVGYVTALDVISILALFSSPRTGRRAKVKTGIGKGDGEKRAYHRSSSNKRPISKIVQIFAIHVRSLILLPPEVLSCSPCAQENAVEVCADDLVVVAHFAFERSALCPWDTGVGDENVQAAIEFFDLFLDCSVELVFV